MQFLKFKLKNFDKSLIALIVVCSFLLIAIIYKKYNKIEGLEGDNNTDKPYKYNADGTKELMNPANAKEACQQVSTRAEEIAAEWAGASEVEKQKSKNNPFGALASYADSAASVLKNATNFMNPESYKSGDNTSKTISRNVITSDLSTNDRTEIEEACNQIVSSTQENIIDVNTDECPYCMEVINIKKELILNNKDPSGISECSVKNVKQSNVSAAKQMCTIKTAIEKLRQKKNSIDAQAFADVLQKTQNVLSGSNKTDSQNCNVISTDMSSNSYFQKKFDCNQTTTVNQKNLVTGCSLFQDIIQSNSNDVYQQCINEMGEQTTDVTGQEATVTAASKIKQTTEGLSPFASLGSSLSSVFVVLIIVGGLVYTATDPGVQQTALAAKRGY